MVAIGKAHDLVAELVHFFVLRVPSSSRTQLIGFLYLTDIEARKYLGEPITDLEYVWYDRGPFDSRILNRLAEATESGVLRETSVSDSTNDPRYVISGKKVLRFRLTDRQTAIAAHVAQEFGKLPVPAACWPISERLPRWRTQRRRTAKASRSICRR